MNLICADCGKKPDDCICAEVEIEHAKYTGEVLNMAHFLLNGIIGMLKMLEHESNFEDKAVDHALEHVKWHLTKMQSIELDMPNIDFTIERDDDE